MNYQHAIVKRNFYGEAISSLQGIVYPQMRLFPLSKKLFPRCPGKNLAHMLSLGMCQKEVILLDSVELVQARNCQVDLTHALPYKSDDEKGSSSKLSL